MSSRAPLSGNSYGDTAAERPCIRLLRCALLLYLALGWPVCALIDDTWSPAWRFKMTDMGAAVGFMAVLLLWVLQQFPQLVNSQRIDQVEQQARDCKARINGYDKAIIGGYFFDEPPMRRAAGHAGAARDNGGPIPPGQVLAFPHPESTPDT